MLKRARNAALCTVHVSMPPDLFKALLRDLLGREAGQPYFKCLAIPRRYRWFGAWRRLPTYQAEQQLLPIGGRQLDARIRQFFVTHGHLRAIFQEGGMPLYAIYVMQHYSAQFPQELARIVQLDCTFHTDGSYQVTLLGTPEPPVKP